MKKIIAWVLLALVLMTAFPTVFAATAADYADLQVSMRPVQDQNGNVVLEINMAIKNGVPEQFIDTVEFRYENDLIAAVDRVSGDSEAYVRSVPLGMSLMGLSGDLEIEVSYIDFNGGYISRIMTVSGEEGEPHLEFKRTASTTAVAQGESIRLTYIVKNEGSVTLTDLEIYDDAPGIGRVGTVDVLLPGDMREFNVDVLMTQDVKSQPRVTYFASSGMQSMTLMLEDMNLVIYAPKLNVTLKSDVSSVQSGDSVTLVCSVVNEGNVSFNNVTISDASLGTIIDSAQIEAGKAYSWNKLIKPVASQNYMFTVRAIDQSGKIYTAASNIVSVEVAAPVGESTDTLEVSVTPNAKELAQPGEIIFNVLLRNTSEQDITGLTISDKSGNVLERINSLPSGDKMIPVAVSVTETGDYYFIVEATLPSGTKVQCVTAPMNIVVGIVQKSEEPLQSALVETPAPTMNALETPVQGIAPWILMLIIFIVLLIVACVVVLILLQIRSRRRRREEDDEQDYIPPQQTYARRPIPPAENQSADPYDYREEISRVATEYSRPVPPKQQPVQNDLLDDDEDEDVQTVYKARKPSEPHTRWND